MAEQRITISLSSLLTILATVLLLVVLWQLQSLVVILMVAVVLAASIVPVVDWAERWRIPRWLGALTAYLAIIGGLVGVGMLIGPTISRQISSLVSQSPLFLERLQALIQNLTNRMGLTTPQLISELLNIQVVTNWVIRSGQQLVLRSFGLTRGIVGGTLSLILAILISGYMVADSRTLIGSLINLLPKPWDDRLAEQVAPIGQRMGSYIRGRVLVSGVLGILITAGLGILGLGEYSLALGTIAAFTNLIPFLGPILGAVPALFVALAQGGWGVLWVLLLFVIIQNLETYVLDPLLVGSSVGVHPLYQLLAVLGGTQVLGILGALIVPPWIAGAAVVLENLYLKPKMAGEAAAEPKAIPLSDGPTPKASLNYEPHQHPT